MSVPRANLWNSEVTELFKKKVHSRVLSFTCTTQAEGRKGSHKT